MHTLFVVTGANRGFGQAITKVLAKQYQPTSNKLSFVLVGRQEAPLQQVANDIQQLGSNIATHVIANASIDSAVATRDTILEPLQAVVKDMQDPPLTSATLINNAGSTGDLTKQVSDYEAEEIQAYFNVNLVSYTTLVSGFLRLFLPTKTPITLVNISSLLGVQPFANWGLYATGKSARDMLLGVVAKEHEPTSVRTLSYAPGPLDNGLMKEICETLGDPEQRKFYNEMAKENKLVNMDETAQKLADLLYTNNFTSGSHLDYYDL
ncbi:sepiapterin reductase [Lichtheimia ornata]|uniref:Sepiapterin reductase n=1 Tax=Lichtheimia ornata TaxID=688661 RepID=A0AAD7UQS9_9FUNG|nr:sepiapterin reductase [Lichtheimia ornata]KAJ8651723.1 sepiapterin reductase [Lichtheimia ornata]